MLQRKSGLALAAMAFCLCLSAPPANGEEVRQNLIPNPEFRAIDPDSGLPKGWHQESRTIPGVEPSRVYFCQVTGHPGKLLAIEGGPDRNGEVWRRINKIRPHTDYLLEFNAYRPKFTNGVYLEVEIFGQRHLLNQHFSYGRIQPMFLRVNSGKTRGAARLAMMNPHREVLAFGSPSLREAGAGSGEAWKPEAVRLPNFFPVGIFAAAPDDLDDIRAAGFNAVQGYDSGPEIIRKMAAAARKLGLAYLPNFRSYQAEISKELGGAPELLGFYIEDEPEGRSVPPEKMKALKESLKRDHPGVLTAAAMLRPQMAAAYRDSADIFMLDPYPVPHMPLTWMAETLDEAARQVSRQRLWAVIQAFGGEKYVKDGWPRRPTYLEMRCLTYLAIVHGARGVFYFSYPEVRQDDQAWQGLTRIAGQLRELAPWLTVPNEPGKLRLEMASAFRADAGGNPAVHFCQKKRDNDSLLILVNVIDRPVNFFLRGFPAKTMLLTEYSSSKPAVIRDGNLRGELGPYEVRVYSFHQGN
ncbi:MAG: hypothetical protein M1438_06840 [Deltaproteobacteria bacterium]|nr:hypothetical protein [Deltaproteobacteria bacterium]